MNRKVYQRRGRGVAALIAASVLVGGCSVEKADVDPPLIGPSELGLSVTMTASPDRLPRDGSSQAVVTVTVRDDRGQAVSGQRLTLAVSPSTAVLSQAEVTTTAEGRATFAVTAPPEGATATGNQVRITATPVGDNAANNTARVLTIGLTGVSNTTAPTPQFTVTPEEPEVNQTVTFDASATTDEGAVCGMACRFAWNFDDGTTAEGTVVTHSFSSARSFKVRLNVTDAAGLSAFVDEVVTVSTVDAPTVTLAVSPDPPLAGQQATLTATATPADGHSITQFSWSFGDGTSATTTTPTVNHTFSTQGVFVVTVTAKDETGQTGSVSKQLTITSSAVNATIVFSPTDPAANQRIHFTAVNATAPEGATIEEFEWNFGDSSVSGGGTAEGKEVSHTYTVGGSTYVVRLTLTDSKGNVGVVTKEVKVD